MKNLALSMSALAALILASCDQDSQVSQATPETRLSPRAHLGAFAFVSSNTNSTLGIYPVGAAIANPASIDLDRRFLSVPYADADGGTHRYRGCRIG